MDSIRTIRTPVTGQGNTLALCRLLRHARHRNVPDRRALTGREHSGLRQGGNPVACIIAPGTCGDFSGSSQHGADTEARDNRDYSPLERVAHEGLHDVELVQVLLEHGADANAQDNERCTPLYLASDWGEPVVAQVLLSHGTDDSPGPV
jgi:ankyrin repeat protein